MRIPPLALVASRPRIVAATRRRAASGWSFTGTTYLASDGASGSYAEAATNAAARVFLPGSVLGTGTFVCWVRRSGIPSDMMVMTCPAASGSALIYMRLDDVVSGSLRATAFDNAGANIAALITNQGSTLDGVAWVLCAVGITRDTHDRLHARIAGTAATATADATPDAHGAGDVFYLFRSAGGAEWLEGDIRSPAVYARDVADTELAALHTIGPTHDLRVASGDYSGGGPAHWWPGDGDSGTTVTDRGSVGGCNLTLNGGVTLEAA